MDRGNASAPIGADGHTNSLFQENPNDALQTPTDLKGFDLMTAVRQLAEQEHSIALAQLASCISAIMKFGADADNDLFVKVKDLITDLIRSQADAPPETNQKSHCDEETSKATEKKEDRDLFSVAYKNAVDNRRAAWRVITSVGQKKKSKSEEQLASYAREYIAKVENELQKIREGVLALMDKKLVPSLSNDESKAFYYKMKSDYHRYLAEQDTEVSETVSRDGVQQRTVEQIVDAPVPQAVEELAEVSTIFSQDMIQQRAVEQTIKNPAVSLVEKIVEIPVTRKTQQGVNTHVQHVVNTVEVERPKLVKETVQEKINQVTKHIKIPQVHFLNKVDDMLVDVQRQILPMAQTAQKTTESPQLQFPDQAVDAPVVVQRQVPQVHVVKKTVEISQLQAVEKIVETPETQTIQGAMKHDDPDAKIKFFTEEALHGVGGLIFDAHGNRVVNELGKRDCVTGEMWENKPPFSLALNNAVSDDRQCKHYTGRGVRKLHESGTALAEDMGVPVSKTPDSIEAHYQASLKTARNPNGEPYPASASEKLSNVASGKTVAHRQVPLIQRVQKMVEVPQVQFIDKVVDILVFNEKRPEQAETRSLGQGGDCEHEEDEIDAQVPGSELVQVAPNMGAGGSHPQATMDQGRDKELREIRRMIEFLVNRERKLDIKTDVAARRLERLERESSQFEDEEREASLEEALADHAKVVKLTVDKWFVDKGFGFGRAPTGEVVFIHASVVQGAEVLVVGTEAWTQVVSDHARAEGGYRPRKAWG